MHRKEWEQEMKILAERKEILEADEMGSISHQRKKRSDTPKKKDKRN